MSTRDPTAAKLAHPDTDTGVDPLTRLAPDTRVAGRYRILGLLGMGGMGIVYKAFDEELEVPIALKVLRPDLGTDPEWVDRFRRELLMAREVNHKNVVRIHDIGESQGIRFLTMRLVEGRSLLDLLEKDGPLPVDRALTVWKQVAEALRQAHEAGVVHRDLKPANILLAPDDVAYVTDFGVARLMTARHATRAGAVVGTLDYLSPEQALGDPVDARSDIYALGIVLFEMLTGELPFQADSRGGGVVAQRITGRARDIAETGVRVPAHVRHVLRRCLERSRARRYRTVDELLADLVVKRTMVRDHLPRPAVLMVAATVLAAGAGGVLANLPRTWRAARAPAPALPPVEVAILPLSDETHDPQLAWTSAGIAEMLSTQLAEAPQLRVVDSTRVLRTLRDLKLDRSDVDAVTLRRIGEMLAANRLVTGSVRRAGPTVRVDLRLVSLDPGPVVGRTLGAEAAAPGGVFRLVADLGYDLRNELGAPPPGNAAAEPPTASLEAARLYQEGHDRLVIGDSVGAAPAFERAVAADPEFVPALLGLSEAYQALGYRDKAAGAAERAVAVVGAAQTRLAGRAHARRALVRGDLAEAEQAYAVLASRYPNDTEALLDLAGAQASQGASARATATLKRVTELDRGDPRAWFLLGKNMILAGDARQAASEPLLRAYTLMVQLGNEQGQADVLNALGVAHHRLGEYPQALTRYGEAAALRQKIGDQRGAAMSLRNRASIHLATGEHARAEPDLQAAREAYARIGDRSGQADVWNDFGALREGRGEYAAARKAYQEALRLRRELGDEHQLAQSYDNVGYAFFLEGEQDSALVYWRQALDLRRKIGDKGGIVLSTQNLGFLQIAQGRWSEAMKSFLDALEKSREIDFSNALAVSQGNLGLLHQYEGRYAAALSAYAEALQILKGLDDRRGLAEYTIKEATALIELGRLGDAGARLDTASAWVRETGNQEQSADLQMARGQRYLASGDAEAARAAFAEAVGMARASHSRPALLRARVARAAALVTLGEAKSWAPELAAAAREADLLGEALLRVRAYEGLARAQLALGRGREAEDSVRRSLRAAENCGWGAGLFRLHALLGQVLEARGDAAGAAKARAESARWLAHVREGIPPELRPSFDGLPAVRETQS